MSQIKAYTIKELTQNLDVTLQGDPECQISGVAVLQHAQPGQLSFLTNALYRKHLASTKASAVVIQESDASLCQTNAIICKNPYYIYAKIAAHFAQSTQQFTGIHQSAQIPKSANIAASACLGANVVIGEHVKIGERVVIGANSVIGDFTTIEDESIINSNVSIYDQVKIGKRCVIASGVIIGSDGFGFANEKGNWHSVPQLGGVSIGNDVSIGANTTIDRGAIEDTRIDDGVKLDNLIQVGHNVHIGAHTIIAGCVAIAGSTTIGKYCMIGGATCFAGHITICDKAAITGMSAVTKSITEPGIYSSGIVGVVSNQEFRKNNARFNRLGQLMDRVKALETQLKEMKERSE